MVVIGDDAAVGRRDAVRSTRGLVSLKSRGVAGVLVSEARIRAVVKRTGASA